MEREEEEKAREKKEISRKLREEVKVEEKYFKLRVDQYLSNLADKSAKFVGDIEKNITEIKCLIETHGELL